MGTSRDANDPRDELRAMNKQARGEFEREQEGDTGGQEHASREDREAAPAERRSVERTTSSDPARAAREQEEADEPPVPRGGPGPETGPAIEPPATGRE